MGDGLDPRGSAGRLGLIAGAGGLPAEAAKVLVRAGYSVEVFGFEGITDCEGCPPGHRTKLGQLERLVDVLRSAGRSRLVILGNFSKTVLFGASGSFDPDASAVRLLASARDWQDAGLMTAIACWLEEAGFEICPQDEALAPMIAQPGNFTRRGPTDTERRDAEFGGSVVRALGETGAGQLVAVRNGAVLALEAIEGSDATIRRAGEFGGPGATIVKAARPGQDRRFDLPAVGPGTIDAMRIAGATALAIEAAVTLVVGADEMRAAADEAGIAIWAFPSHELGR